MIYGLALLLAAWGCSDGKGDDSTPTGGGIEQALATSLVFEEQSVEFPSGGKTAEVPVKAVGGVWQVAEAPAWLDVTPGEDRVTLTTDDNRNGDSRSGKLRITGAEGVAASLDVSQGNGAMVLLYEVEAAGAAVRLPLDGYVECSIDWGDGIRESVNGEIGGLSGGPSHDYSAPGSYRVSVRGKVSNLSSVLIAEQPRGRLKAVETWGATGLENMKHAFYFCTGLERLASPAVENSFAGVTTFNKAFNGCDALRQIPADLFAGCSAATDMSSCFNDCDALTSVPEGLFDDCASVETFRSVFAYCRGLQTVPGRLFARCAKAADMDNVFTTCESLTGVPADLFAGCSAATGYAFCFSGCTALEQIPRGLFDESPLVESFQSAFIDCTALKSVPEGLFDKHTLAVKFNFTFADCEGLESVPVSLFDNCRSITACTQTFRLCSSWAGESPYTMVGDVKVHLYERSEYPDAFPQAPSAATSGTFRACTLLSDYAAMSADYPKWVK